MAPSKSSPTRKSLRHSTTARPNSFDTVQIAHRPLKISLPSLNIFFEWTAERDRIRRQRSEGKSPPWSKNETFSTHKFCHVFRIFDRGSQFLLHNVINKGDQEHREICFRVILFKLFNRVSTWEVLEDNLGPLKWATFDLKNYTRVLGRQAEGNPIYTSAYQIPPPKIVKGPGFKNHLRVLQMMMDDDLPGKLKSCTHMRDAYELIKLYPGMGKFLSYQMVLDMNMTPEISYPENDWAVCGPGSQGFLEKIFGSGVRGVESDAIEYLYKTQAEHYSRLRITDPPAISESRPGLSFVDIEHSLCECSKYVRCQGKEGKWRASSVPITNDLPAKWVGAKGPTESISESRPSSSPTSPSVSGSDSDEDIYEVSHIVQERLVSGRLVYRIRWKGYGPEEDSWKSGKDLQDASEVLNRWRSRKLMEAELEHGIKAAVVNRQGKGEVCKPRLRERERN